MFANVDDMPAPTHPTDQLRYGSYQSRCLRVRGAIWLDRNSDRQARQRHQWPELWQALDALLELVNEHYPPDGVPPPPPAMFDPDIPDHARDDEH